MLAIDLNKISPKVRAVVVLATSLSGNFSEVAQIRSFVRKVTYMKDEMASRPGIPTFKTHKIIENRLLFNVGIVPSAEVSNNCLIMYKIYRDHDNHSQWRTNIVMKQCQTRTKSEIMDKLEIHLGDIFEQMKPENQRLLPDVQSICTSLSSHALPHLKKYFTMDSEGLSIRTFVKVIFKQLLKGMPRLAEEKVRTRVSGISTDGADTFLSYSINKISDATRYAHRRRLPILLRFSKSSSSRSTSTVTQRLIGTSSLPST